MYVEPYNLEERANHGPAELVEEAKHGDRVGDLEARVSVPPFAKKVLCDAYALYRRERHLQIRELQTLEIEKRVGSRRGGGSARRVGERQSDEQRGFHDEIRDEQGFRGI
jgi:hypothetical protein